MKGSLTAEKSSKVLYCIQCDEIYTRLPQKCVTHQPVRMTAATAKQWRLPMHENTEKEAAPVETRRPIMRAAFTPQ